MKRKRKRYLSCWFCGKKIRWYHRRRVYFIRTLERPENPFPMLFQSRVLKVVDTHKRCRDKDKGAL